MKLTMTPEWRTYRQANIVPLMFVAVVVSLAMFAGSIAFAAAHPGTKAVLLIVFVLIPSVAIVIYGVVVLPKVGVTESSEGLRSRPGLRSSSARWEDIRTVRVTTAGGVWAVIFLDLRKGTPIYLPMGQGKRITWHGGDTRDIASVLVERINAVLAERGSSEQVDLVDTRKQPAAPRTA